MKTPLIVFLFLPLLAAAQLQALEAARSEAHLDTQPREARLLGTWHDLTLPGSSAYNNTYNDVWGLALNGREFAVIGSTMGLHFIDVTDPALPVQVDFVRGGSAGSVIIHRDFKNYRCYLYAVCDEGERSTLQIIDFSYLPDSVHMVYDDDFLLRRSHNLFVDTTRAMLYTFATAGGAPGYSAMRVYDLADPTSPVYINEYQHFGGITAGHVHDGYVDNGLAYLNLGPDGFAVVDFSDPRQPRTLGTFFNYPFAGYNHSGWPSADGQHFFMADETHASPIKVLDVRDPAGIEVVDTLSAETGHASTIPHNQLVACNYLYVSYYYDGLQVFDISDPTDPKRVLYYDTSTEPYDNSYRGAWGVYPFLPSGHILVSDMQKGLFVLEGPGDDCAARQASVACDGLTPVREPEQPAPVVYPQPAREVLTIVLPEGQQKVKATLLDLQGRRLARWETDRAGEWTIQRPAGLPAGLYLLRMELEGRPTIAKVAFQ